MWQSAGTKERVVKKCLLVFLVQFTQPCFWPVGCLGTVTVVDIQMIRLRLHDSLVLCTSCSTVPISKMASVQIEVAVVGIVLFYVHKQLHGCSTAVSQDWYGTPCVLKWNHCILCTLLIAGLCSLEVHTSWTCNTHTSWFIWLCRAEIRSLNLLSGSKCHSV